ncbi:MAG: cell division protein FtsZ [Myxococcota bacterium]
MEGMKQKGPRIRVIGVGGGGGNAINTMIQRGIAEVDFIAANTDGQVLNSNKAETKLHLGSRIMGAGAKPEVGASAAKESLDRIEEVLRGSDMVFVAAGMGGGTGTGAAPIIAEVSKRVGALTVGVVTKPFVFEGKRRRKLAQSGVENLKQAVDTLIVVPNDRLLQLAGPQTSMTEAFSMADAVLFNAVKGISDIITKEGIVNVDFADAISVMSGQGMALMGIGEGRGDDRCAEAARHAISSPLLEDVSVEGATGILVNVTGGPSLSLHEVNAAVELITDAAHEDANIIFGYVVDEKKGDEVSITVIATGFEEQKPVGASGLTAGLQQRPAYGSTAYGPALPVQGPAASAPARAMQNPWRSPVAQPATTAKPPHTAQQTKEHLSVLSPTEEGKKTSKNGEYDVPTFLRRHNNISSS